MGDNFKYFLEQNVWEVYLKSSQQSTRVVATLRQMPVCEKANIRYANNFVEESKDK